MSLRVIDPNKEKKSSEAIDTNAPLNPSISGGSGSSAPISPNGQAPVNQNQRPASTAAPSSGSFTDLGKYKQAAVNAGGRIAEGVNRTISGNLNKGESSLNAAKKDFETNVDKGSGYAATEEGRRQAIANVAGYTSAQSGYVPPPTNNMNQQMPQRGVAPSQRQNQVSSDFAEKDFTDVINKKYAGITSAGELESYGKAKEDADKIASYNKLIQDRNKASNLMSSTFSNRGDMYTEGMNALDSYLYNKSGAAGTIKSGQPFQNAANFQNVLSSTEKGMGNYVADRMKQIDEMRQAARSEFSNVAQNRTQQVEDRLDEVRKNWDNLTNMLRSNFYDPETGEVIKGDVQLDPLSARLLQIRGGAQLFNIAKDRASLNDFIKSREFERDRLIGSQEQQNLARLEALSKLAKSPGMEYINKYYDASRAGTLSARDSIDQENIRKSLENAMLGFKENALKNQTGVGSDTSSYKTIQGGGGFLGLPEVVNRQFTTQGSQSGNLAASLDKANYAYEVPTYDKNFIGNDYSYDDYKNNLQDPNAGSGLEIFNPNQLASLIKGMGNNILSDFTSRPVDVLASLALGSEWNESARKRESQARSDVRAAEDLVNKLKDQLQTEGFYNNAMVADPTKNEEAKRRYEAIRTLLSGLDATNVGNY